MKPIKLNHELIKREVSGRAATLLLLGGLVSGAMLFYAQHITQKVAQLHREIERLSPDAKLYSQTGKVRVSQAMSAIKLEETTAVNAAIKQITLPWPSLFKTLESTNREDIKLLSVAPNAKQQSLRIVALALNDEGMMDYIDALSRQPALTKVVLLSQESTDIHQQKVIEFTVEAVWKI